MKATIRDKDTLRALDPIQLAVYLRSHSWREVEHLPEKASTWFKRTESGEEYEILLPLNKNFKDFHVRVSEIIGTLEIEEKRSQLDILENLTNSLDDLVGLRLTNHDCQDGTILLKDAVNLHINAKELILSRACSVVEKKLYFESRKPFLASKYSKKLRLGQSKVGSYILTVISPLDAIQNSLFEEQPFERKVIIGLSNSLNSILNFSQSVSLREANLEVPEELIQDGINANLCEALVEIFKSGNSEDIEISFKLSSVLPVPQNFQEKFLLPRRIIPIVASIGRQLKKAFFKNFEVRGEVYKLQRQRSDSTGKIFILANVDESLRSIKVELPEDIYSLAATAHKERRWIMCQGELAQEGRSFKLDNPRNFRVL